MSSGRKRKREGRKGRANRSVLRGGANAGFGSEPELRMNEAFARSIRQDVPEWMKNLSDDDDVSVIIAAGDGPAPEHAAELLGTLTKPGQLEDGTPLPAGSRIYRNARETTREEIEADPRMMTLRFGDLEDIVRDGGNEGMIDLGRPAPLGESRTAAAGPASFSRADVFPGSVIPPDLRGAANEALATAGKPKPAGARGPQSAAELAALGLPSDILGGPTAAKAAEIVKGGASGHIVHGDPEGSGRGRQPGIPAAYTNPSVRRDPETTGRDRAMAAFGRITGLSAEEQRVLGNPENSEIAAAMEKVSPGLTARLAEGLGKDELARLAPEIARAMTAAQQLTDEAEGSYARARELIAGRDASLLVRDAEAAEAVPVRTSWTGDHVLDHHAWLVRHYSSGSPELADYLAYLMHGVQEQAGDEKGASVFFPADLDGPATPAAGHQLARIIARGLREAHTYQVTGPMTEKMRQVFSEIDLGIGRLDGAELPAPAGFAWLDRPWLLSERGGFIMPFRAVSWEKATRVIQRDGTALAVDAVRVIMWTLSADDVAFGRWDDPRRAGRAATLVGQLTPQHIMLLPFGYSFGVNSGFEDQGSAMLALLHILWMFLGMELTASRSQPASSPHTARRVAKSLKHDRVHVITLRRVAYISEGPVVPREVNRTCRWWVDDFCRHIDHYEDTGSEGRRRRHEAVPAGRTGHAGDDGHDVCAVCLAAGQTVRITRVRGHQRGPSWLPLKKPAKDRTLYRLSR